MSGEQRSPLHRRRPTTMWLAGQDIPFVIDGPLVDDENRPDPDDWKRYRRECAAVEDRARDAWLARVSDV